MFEIVLKTSDNKILAVDAKVNIDDNAPYRQKHMLKCAMFFEENQTEEAKEVGLNHRSDGTVGCMVNCAD
jgi:succinyl-CoA synthetase beta subunit